jgi:hypothetical protein
VSFTRNTSFFGPSPVFDPLAIPLRSPSRRISSAHMPIELPLTGYPPQRPPSLNGQRSYEPLLGANAPAHFEGRINGDKYFVRSPALKPRADPGHADVSTSERLSMQHRRLSLDGAPGGGAFSRGSPDVRRRSVDIGADRDAPSPLLLPLPPESPADTLRGPYNETSSSDVTTTSSRGRRGSSRRKWAEKGLSPVYAPGDVNVEMLQLVQVERGLRGDWPGLAIRTVSFGF